MAKDHIYRVTTTWVGNQGTGTQTYKGYTRDHVYSADGKPDLLGSADPAFRGDPARWNPEELLLASLSSCHKLWYLHLCSTNGVLVEEYVDNAIGTMSEHPNGSGEFSEVTLNPHVTISTDSDADLAARLHHDVPALCFIARSVNFPVHHQPTITKT